VDVSRRAALLTLAGALRANDAPISASNQLRMCLPGDPKTFDPLLVTDSPSETYRYLTAGVLIRFHRAAQRLDPELAETWQVLDGGRRITFRLRRGISFSDGTPFSAEDVAETVRRMMDPNLHSPTGDTFRSSSVSVRAEAAGPYEISLTFEKPIAGLAHLFDELAVSSARSPHKDSAVLGPYMLAEHKPGSYLMLRRNPNYWKRDSRGYRLPYIDSIRLDIQENRETELLRFLRGEVHLINSLTPEMFERVRKDAPSAARDMGPSLDSEFLWFNLSPAAPLPAFKRAWFESVSFRQAITAAINREDMCRVAYLGHARPATGPYPASSKQWFNAKLAPPVFDPKRASALLTHDGFQRRGSVLQDRAGNVVEFSVITNAGSKTRIRLATMMQQDLSALGIRLNVVTLDFPSLIERITARFDYEACLLGLTNVELDPNGQMNVWLSSGRNHPWNPGQKKPATPWEAEIDKLMHAQASTADYNKRKESFDRVQEILQEQAPILYLVNRNALAAFSPLLRNADPTPFPPELLWNVEWLWFAAAKRG
jgi:peptide/nickel transport system substrate-binding protein